MQKARINPTGGQCGLTIWAVTAASFPESATGRDPTAGSGREADYSSSTVREMEAYRRT